jgi:pimeloyl-ACP methyl ester carboxylesterase
MTHIPLVRSLATWLSLLILAAAAYLLWTWYQGDWVRASAGDLVRMRDDWRLWAGGGALLWSLLGGKVLVPLLTKKDEVPTQANHGTGELIESSTGSKLFVEAYGRPNGPPIIFTHGWGMDSTFWHYAKRDLGDRFRLILWDLPGLGKSKAGSPGGVTLRAFAQDLAVIIALAGSQRPVLVGHSIGGMTIQTLLRDRPEIQSRLAGVVLLNTTYTNPLRTMILSGFLRAMQRPLLEPGAKLTMLLQPLVWLMQWQSYLSGSAHLAHRLGFGRYVTRSQLEHTTLLSVRNPPAVQAKGTLEMFHWDATGAMRNVRIPTLVIGGDKDIVTKLEASRTIAGDANAGELRVVEGGNHMGPMERADLYNELIGNFALTVQPAAGSDVSVDKTTSVSSGASTPVYEVKPIGPPSN